MSDEIKVDAAKFDRILGRMLEAKPLPKSEISARIREQRETARKMAAELRVKNREYKSKKLGQ